MGNELCRHNIRCAYEWMRVLDYVLFYAAVIIGVPAICDFSRNQKTEKRGRNFGGFS